MGGGDSVEASTYQDIRPLITSGSVVLFSGSGVFSSAIRAATLSRWTHVGIAVRLEGDAVMLLESDALPTRRGDASGVRMVELSARVADYGEGNVGVRVATFYDRGLGPQRRVHESLLESRRTFEGRPYESSRVRLFLAAYDGPLGRSQREDLTTLFCSEFAAEILARAGVISKTTPSAEWTPADFSGQVLDRRTRVTGVDYAPIVRIQGEA